MAIPRDYYREHLNRRQGDADDELTTPSVHLHWERRVGPGVGRRSRLVSYIFVLLGTALAAIIVLTLIMLYSMGEAVSG